MYSRHYDYELESHKRFWFTVCMIAVGIISAWVIYPQIYFGILTLLYGSAPMNFFNVILLIFIFIAIVSSTTSVIIDFFENDRINTFFNFHDKTIGWLLFMIVSCCLVFTLLTWAAYYVASALAWITSRKLG